MARKSEKKEKDPFQKAKWFLDGLTQVVEGSTCLVSALIPFVVVTTTLVGMSMAAFQQPASKKLPPQCTSQVLSVLKLPPVQAANKVFWNRHPELKQRKIRSYESEFSKEWNRDFDQIESCRNQQK